jgi:hypothetical protein
VGDAEVAWAVVAGVVGLVSLVVGSFLVQAPAIDADVRDAVASLAARRAPVLAGSLLSTTGSALLLWPIAVVASAPGGEVWRSAALLSVALSVGGFLFLAVAALAHATVAWRAPVAGGDDSARLLLDAAHLATWSVSAPIAAVSVVATTAVAVQADLAGTLVVVASVVKVATVAVEVAGIGVRSGWNAGGWVAGTSGYATVGWFAALLVALW